MTSRHFISKKKVIVYWTLRPIVSIVNFFFDCVLFILHGRKGKTVPPVKNPLLMKSATKLAEEIRDGKLKSEVVIEAYINRILEVDSYINAAVERCFEAALKEAREVDSLVESGKYSKEELSETKPLLGIPFTVKGVLCVKGLPCTSGSLLSANEIAPEDAESVAAMKKAGAIVIALTNTPEWAMYFETMNKVYGTTYNPYDTNRTCGGSSGGESALISAGGSLLGLGNDLSGSVRIPANFCGIFSHKPTRGLVSNKGSVPPTRLVPSPEPYEPEMVKYLYTGPMCRYAEDLIMSMRVLCVDDKVKMNFGKKVDFKKLKVCYLIDARSHLSPTVDKEIIAGLKRAVSYFKEEYDIKVKEVHMPCLLDANRCIVTSLVTSTGDIIDTVTGGKGLQFDVRKDLLKYFYGKSTLSFMTLIILNLAEIPIWCRKDMKPYFDSMVQHWISELDSFLDEDTVLLMPSYPTTAPYCYGSFFKNAGTFHCSVFNITGSPATQCPLGFDEQGLPYGIQIIGRPNNDALTIACALELEKAFGGWISPGTI